MSVKYWCHDTPDKVCAKRNLNIPSPTLFFWQENSESHRKKNSCSKYSSNWFSNSPTSPEWWWQKLWSLSALTNSFCMVDASTRLRSNSWDIMSPCEPPPDQWFIGCTLSKATFLTPLCWIPSTGRLIGLPSVSTWILKFKQNTMFIHFP